MAFLNGKKRSKLFVVTLLIVSMIATSAVSVYATDNSGGSRNPPATEETLNIDSDSEPANNPEQESANDPEQESVPQPELTSYAVEYETTAGEKLLQDKVVVDQTIWTEVTEIAEEVEGYSVDEPSKSITLEESENVITFIYTQVEEPVEEELPPVTEPPVTTEEAVTEPAIVLEPGAAALTITHRLIVDGEIEDCVQVIDNLTVGQTVDLAQYLVSVEWAECITQEMSINLDAEENTVILEYVMRSKDTESIVYESDSSEGMQ